MGRRERDSHSRAQYGVCSGLSPRLWLLHHPILRTPTYCGTCRHAETQPSTVRVPAGLERCRTWQVDKLIGRVGYPKLTEGTLPCRTG